MRKIRQYSILALMLALLFTFTGCESDKLQKAVIIKQESQQQAISLETIPEFSGEPYIVLNSNKPDFDEGTLKTESFESYSELDDLGRCGPASANIGKELMPIEARGKIGQIKPSGWHTIKYDCVDGKYLYNRCHLIGYQLSGENANEKNLITGTRYMNTEGMLPFENLVAEYVRTTGHHVMYRITPIFKNNNLVASGVQMEGESVEDREIQFNVFVYNNQPGISIDYATGNSHLDYGAESKNNSTDAEATYIINKNTHIFHVPDCSSVKDMKPQNRKETTKSRDELLLEGNRPCSRCNP
ncbi:DNA/RNA non-specific endonuclease [Clostridium sp. C105KSO13]|uniref:DNA/RNA non-specific endonuclease n=1 Tax=Clostridium sp. C105KSO13 TaxID=1776045 RepID=UPI0007408145|nr:DNA/RNA non-specific endonuclease [Clostridium sp. C105KSO13]CUX28405.1 DNA-entry nuclease [Clostridium sp. C105KSO13]